MKHAKSKSPFGGNNTKVTRQEWLRAAAGAFTAKGVDNVRVMPLAKSLRVSRSSFYWYFKDRNDLLAQILSLWRDTNTKGIVDRASRPADSIIHAIQNIFECWVDDEIFDPQLDTAVRAWSRTTKSVRQAVDEADAARVFALRDMFQRHGYDTEEALIRARVLYFTQIGYYALDVKESLEERFSHLSAYLRSFTGVEPSERDLHRFRLEGLRPSLKKSR